MNNMLKIVAIGNLTNDVELKMNEATGVARTTRMAGANRKPKSLAEFRAIWARKGLRSFSAAACTSPKILLAKRASNWPPLADNRGAERSAGLHRPLAAGGLYCQKGRRGLFDSIRQSR